MEEEGRIRRRADSATVVGEEMVLYRPSGAIARIALVVDRLDDDGLRTPLVEDVLTAFPHAELHVAEDLRADPAPLAGRTPTVWTSRATARRGLFRRRRVDPTPTPAPGDHDVVLRIGDRRSRGFTAAPEALDLTYILDLDGGDEAGAALGASLRDRCAMQAADRVWCGTRRLLATLRRRWKVEAELLYPPAALHGAHVVDHPRRLVVAAADGVSPAWNARLDTLARWRRDLSIVKHGAPATAGRGERHARVEPATPARFAALLPHALAVVLPPGEGFDPRAIWAAEAGVPVVTPINGAGAELVDGLEHGSPTGVLMDEATDTALADAVGFVERQPALFTPARLRRHAERWRHDRFRNTLKSLVLNAWCAHLAERGDPEEEAESPADIDATPREAPVRATAALTPT